MQQILLCWSMHARNHSTGHDGLGLCSAVSIAHNTGAVSAGSHADNLASHTATQLSKAFRLLMQTAEELTVTVKLLQYESVCCPATAVRSSSRSYTPCRRSTSSHSSRHWPGLCGSCAYLGVIAICGIATCDTNNRMR